MSKLEQLINELCPDGIEYKLFGEIATISRGASPRPIKNFITDSHDGINWIKIGDVKNGTKYVEGTKEKITEEGAKKSRFVKKGDFILSNSMSFGRPYILNIDGCIHDGWLSISDFENDFTSDFLYHLLSSHKLQEEMRKRASFGGAVQNLNADIVKALVLPIPPLPVQNEISQILDNFTKHTLNLTLDLTDEFLSRKQQFEYYRDTLLTFDDGVESKPLIECLLKTNNIKWSEYKDFEFQYVDLSSVNRDDNKISETQSINSETAPSRAQQIILKDDVIFGSTRPMLKRYCLINDHYHNQICSTGFCVLRANQAIVLPKWIYFIISSTDFYNHVEKYQIGASYPAISDSEIKNYKIPVPPLPEQQRIVGILDRYDKLCKDISEVLLLEVKAREEQYEYYRDKLLTFKEKEVCADE